jgi:hypothetical protein
MSKVKPEPKFNSRKSCIIKLLKELKKINVIHSVQEGNMYIFTKNTIMYGAYSFISNNNYRSVGHENIL